MPLVQEIHGRQQSGLAFLFQPQTQAVTQHVLGSIINSPSKLESDRSTLVSHGLISFDLLLTFIQGLMLVSVMGFVYSYNHDATIYAALTKIQQPRLELDQYRRWSQRRALKQFLVGLKVQVEWFTDDLRLSWWISSTLWGLQFLEQIRHSDCSSVMGLVFRNNLLYGYKPICACYNALNPRPSLRLLRLQESHHW